MYFELQIDERDIQFIDQSTAGRVAFTSRPGERFPVSVRRIEPAATIAEGTNRFTIVCDFTGIAEPWWRPGMSGVARLDGEQRRLIWIYTHRTLDFLRLRLWW